MFALTGCASIQWHKNQWVKDNCNAKAAFDLGVVDKKNNQKQFYSFQKSGNIYWCGDNTDKVRQSYLQGYQSTDLMQGQQGSKKNTVKHQESDTIIVHFD